MVSNSPHELLDIVESWLDAQSEGPCENDQILQRNTSTVRLRVLVSAGAKVRTSCDLPAQDCHSVNKLLKEIWEVIQEKVTLNLPKHSCKWWEGVVLIGHSSLETKKSPRTKLLGMNIEHQKTWVEWRHRNLEAGYQQVYTIGVAFGVPHVKRILR